MKAILLPAAFGVAVTGLALSSTPAPARGCLKGAVVGGVAGHFDRSPRAARSRRGLHHRPP
jgi:hypothetical protein